MQVITPDIAAFQNPVQETLRHKNNGIISGAVTPEVHAHKRLPQKWLRQLGEFPVTEANIYQGDVKPEFV